MTKTVYDPSTSSSNRREIMRGLISLPLIGGGAALIGSPTQAAEPPSRQLLAEYANWLNFERRLAQEELCGPGFQRDSYEWHGPAYEWHRQDGLLQPSSRAAIVLSAVGCDWRSDCQ